MIILMTKLCVASDGIVDSIFDALLTKELLPATLTFITAILGIIAQLVISQITSQHLRRSEIKKLKLNCIKNFYIPLMTDLISYNTNIKILHSHINELDIFDSNDSNLRKYNSNLKAIYESIQNIARINLDNYYPINKELNSATMEMLFYMIKADKIISLPVDSRSDVLSSIKISTAGYDVDSLINMIYSKGIPKGL